MVKVLVVIPYEETRIHFEKVIKRYQGKGVSFTITSLFGTDYRRLQMVKNYDIVVVRGMTRSAISSFFPEIPIVPIAINVSDLLEALLEVKNLYGSHSKVGVLYSDAFMCSETTISSLISMEINMRTISNEVEMIERINELKNKGCNVFVGGLTLQRYCSSRKMPVVSLKTGVETIEKSIQEAFNSAFIIRKERLHVDLLKSISDNLMEPLIVSNGKNEVVAYNIKAKQVFGELLEEGLQLSSILPKGVLSLLKGSKKKFEEVDSIGDEQYLVSMNGFETAEGEDLRLINFKKVYDVYETEKIVRSQIINTGFTTKYSFSNIVAEQLSMRQLIAKAIRYAKSDVPLLINGETGTGKELFAQAVHNGSTRANGPFVAVNCASFGDYSLEYELFGHTENGGKAGLFEMAQGGTLFLDEIGDMSLKLQGMLLRVLLEGEVRRVGGSENIPIDVRVISSTNANIPSMIEKGCFRLDLYYRLNVLSLTIPPLRERPLDIAPLFKTFVNNYAKEHKMPVPTIDQEVLMEMEKYKWPGNVKELKNIVNRVMVSGERHISIAVVKEIDFQEGNIPEQNIFNPLKTSKLYSSKALYEKFCNSGLTLEEFSKNEGISRTTLWRRFKYLKQN